ncbi:S8 family peptidase [Kitasatospora cheerisanensis]|uniref:Putative peptidase S08 family protein n=1 Tax=Kitasatospora cheerisanensis KCTC 2395 TaxID=1348663 RepID=A0A066YNE5_9ACTN|nr:S8 family serine peptidase [Kitasatospora cheerisanensis]KDN83013.1 putative peptidase S08 family protein [Kitasatospora cheerisanensis KCTC 2395]
MRTAPGLLAALALLAPAAPATAAPPAGPHRPTTTVLLELDTEPAATAWRRAQDDARRDRRTPEQTRRAAAAAGTAGRAAADRSLDTLTAALHRAVPDARPLYRTRTLIGGLAVRLPADELPRLTGLPGLRAVHPVTPKRRANGHSVPLTGAPAVWDGPEGHTGEGVRIGIVDSGIDYTHADFGGPGTPEAYRAVDGAGPAPAGLFPNAKVIGGKDLVGDDYDPDPAAEDYQPEPHPDDNPLDCAANGHGTHVAGTAAGLGVTADGRPYRGPYRPGLDPAAFRVAPGAAPGAQLYAIKVFGCHGSTDQLAAALDLAADPNGDGDLTDRLDVVNLSLGSAFGRPGDADALAADRLAALGSVVVAAAGNEGDVYGIGGSPGSAARVLTAAASVDPHGDADGITVLAPAALAGTVPAHWSSKYTQWDTAAVSGELAAPAEDLDGCDPFSPADADRLRGRIAVLRWTTKDSDRACGSAPRADHAADAGAIGALYAADGDNLGEIAGDDRIPAAILARADGDRLLTATQDGPVTVRLAAPGNALHGAVPQDQPRRTDTLTSFTSRGIGVDGIVKPDLAAPGETIWSAKAGTGSGGMREDGTSMATPHLAGLAALVRSAHPDWSAADTKAALMNTATDTYLHDDRTGPVYGPERTGSGRARADAAVRTPALAYATQLDGAVGVSFGVVEATGRYEASREVEVRNLTDRQLSYRTGYSGSTEVPGARFALSPERVELPPHGTATVTVTLRLAHGLGRAPDPTLDLLQAGHARTYRGELSGRLTLTPADPADPALRVPLFAAPRPATDATALGTPATFAVTGGTRPDLLSVLQPGGAGERWPDCPADGPCADDPADRAADLRYAAAAVDEHGMLHLAAVLWAPAATPAASYGVRASLDLDGDGTPDATVVADRLRGSDVLIARTLDARTGAELDVQPLNGHWGDTDTALLDSDTVLLPVRLSALPAATNLHYTLWTAPTQDPADALSTLGPYPLDLTRPTPVLHPATPGETFHTALPNPLLIHHLNPVGQRVQLLTPKGDPAREAAR